VERIRGDRNSPTRLPPAEVTYLKHPIIRFPDIICLTDKASSGRVWSCDREFRHPGNGKALERNTFSPTAAGLAAAGDDQTPVAERRRGTLLPESAAGQSA